MFPPAPVPDLFLVRRVCDGQHILEISGMVNAFAAPAIADAVFDACRDGARALVLDVGFAQFDGDGLAALVDVVERVRRRGLALAYVHADVLLRAHLGLGLEDTGDMVLDAPPVALFVSHLGHA